MEEAKTEQTDQELENERLKEENERLREEIERVRNLPMKERLYDKIHVTVRVIDFFIIMMILLAIIVTVIGMNK